jgi:PAS domain S-box-containing protein
LRSGVNRGNAQFDTSHVDSTGLASRTADATRLAELEHELRELRERYRSLFDNALEGVFRTSFDGRWLAANATMAQMLGFDSAEELMRSSHVRDFYADPSERDRLIRRMDEDGFVVGYEHHVRRRDGSTMWVLMNAYTLRDENGQPVGFEGMEIDITERKRAEEHRARLLAQTVRAAEDERTRLAAELHDGPIQRLARVGYVLERGAMQLERGDAGKAKELVTQAHADLAEEIVALRQTMKHLRPPVLDERGLSAALHDLAGATTKDTNVRVEVDVTLRERLEESLETIIYRVVQEALRNVVRHAAATAAHVHLRESDDGVILTVDDDGVGFDVGTVDSANEDGHFGIAGMNERTKMAGGEWMVTSSPGAGTQIRARFPRAVR